MAGFGSFVMAMAAPVARQVMTALGFGVVSFIGVDLAVSGLLDQARANWSSMGAGVAAYVALSGANHGLSLVAGAIVGRVALIPLKRMQLL
ncbi:DUF2523 family protein [Paucibacter sediminis]|uniref:DUF2523 family protein n=1 Tax=Paucibacter sediminis TaxID=3019553 RepID=A0AA95N9Y2_9BURK|nr:DUF2523 family protein [Paucibacter sp. S2-9]WIT11127.1 DUF2523 family protein [Paucibacter sp. S2-9]